MNFVEKGHKGLLNHWGNVPPILQILQLRLAATGCLVLGMPRILPGGQLQNSHLRKFLASPFV